MSVHCQRRVEAAVARVMGVRRWADHVDAVQEALLRAFQSFAEFRGDSNPCTWMSSFGRNVALNHARKQHRRREELVGSPIVDLPTPEGLTAPEAQVVGSELREWLLRSLSGEYRETFVLKYIEGLSDKEIAERLFIAPGTVASRLNRIRAAARVVLERYDR